MRISTSTTSEGVQVVHVREDSDGAAFVISLIALAVAVVALAVAWRAHHKAEVIRRDAVAEVLGAPL